MFAVAGLNVVEGGNDTGHVTVQLFLPPSAFSKIKTPVYWEPAAYGQYNWLIFWICLFISDKLFLLHDASIKQDLSRHVVSVHLSFRPSIHLSRSYILSKRIKISSEFFHRQVATPVFPYQMSWQYSDGDPPPNGASIAGGVGRNRDSEPIPGSMACCEWKVQYT